MRLQLIAYVLITVSALTFAWLYLFGLRDYYDDVTRQRLFNIRNDLWDRAQAAEIDPDSKAYELIRRTLNGYLRYVHRLTLFHLLVMIAWFHVRKRSKDGFAKEFNDALASLPEDQQKILIEAHQATALAIARHLLTVSWIFRPVTWALPLLNHYQRVRLGVLNLFQSLTEKADLDELAEREGLRCAV